jgi:hypothetical protein
MQFRYASFVMKVFEFCTIHDEWHNLESWLPGRFTSVLRANRCTTSQRQFLILGDTFLFQVNHLVADCGKRIKDVPYISLLLYICSEKGNNLDFQPFRIEKAAVRCICVICLTV